MTCEVLNALIVLCKICVSIRAPVVLTDEIHTTF